MSGDWGEEWIICTGDKDYRHKRTNRHLWFAPNATSIGGNRSFTNCTEVREVDLCNVTDVGLGAFLNCR